MAAPVLDSLPRALPFFLGECRNCRGRCRTEASIEIVRGARSVRLFFTLGNGQRYEGSTLSKNGIGFGRFFARCLCTGQMEFRQVVGVPTQKKCNGVCMHAKGNICDCSCGGVNHGCGG